VTDPPKRTRAQLLLPLLNRAAFLDAYMSKGQDGGGLFVPGDIDVELGEDVDVELAFAEEHVRFTIRAKVAWKRANAGRRALPPGVGIAFADGQQRTEQQILRFAEGKESVSH
jgi:Tfp pilus assembly protein PilZ